MTDPAIPLTPEQVRTAIQDPEHLRRWIAETRPWIVFRGNHLIEALPWPHGHEAFQQIVTAYRHHRLPMESGEVVLEREPLSGQMVEVPAHLDERLSPDELDACIRWLVEQIRAVRPEWSL